MTTILLLAVFGILALIAELVLPGGVLGVAGVGCLVAAVILTFVEYGAGPGIAALFALAVTCVATLSLWMRHFHRLPLTRKLILEDEIAPGGHGKESGASVGRTGTALTDLRPSGKVEIDGERRDASAESQTIVKGAAIEVVDDRGHYLVVRERA